MDKDLYTLARVFTDSLFRIPDYQRGYAWRDEQLRDFWNDLIRIRPGATHYTGVLTLELVPDEVFQRWEDDQWLIESKSFRPYYVVDGQQRLTTSLILIQSILDSTPEGQRLNHTSQDDIRQRFICDSKDGGISRSYVFGYEKDDPSYEFLKTKIFGDHSSTDWSGDETLYTQNLLNAKNFFDSQLKGMQHQNKEEMLLRVSQRLRFNVFTIGEEVDVCVAFETINNRGKRLSHLELLKNRLMYLSTLFDASLHERSKLRRTINDAWRTMYQELGYSSDNPLDDDSFLRTHFVLTFSKITPKDVDGSVHEANEWDGLLTELYPKNARLSVPGARVDNYKKYLLEEWFVPATVDGTITLETAEAKPVPSNEIPSSRELSLGSVHEYVTSLQKDIRMWRRLALPQTSKFPNDVQIWLDKFARLGEIRNLDRRAFQPVLLAFFQKTDDTKVRLGFLKSLERLMFLDLLTSGGYWHLQIDGVVMRRMSLFPIAVELYQGKRSPADATKAIDAVLKKLAGERMVMSTIRQALRKSNYKWPGIRYLLFEYNLHLQESVKEKRPKIFWPEFTEPKEGFHSIEHIYPQKPQAKYWKDRFSHLKPKERSSLRDSLGNLLPLAQSKNSSLGNRPFTEKVNGGGKTKVGYRYGSYAEIEVAEHDEWRPEEILARGEKILNFIHDRWGIDVLGKKKPKEVLGLPFL